ncbi:MAG: hypothetical protein R3B72_43765 [Polyangiaceae bacterium]
MTMKTAAMASLCITTITTNVFADEAMQDEPPPTASREITTPAEPAEPADDAVIAGIGLGGAGGGLGGLGALGGVVPYFTGSLEHRVAEHTYLFGGGRGGISLSSADQRSYSFEGMLGFRHALSDRQPIEVSWSVRALGAYEHSDLQGVTSNAYRVGLATGLVLDKHFNDWFGLRLDLEILRGTYSHYETEASEPAHEFRLAAFTSPTFALRFAF